MTHCLVEEQLVWEWMVLKVLVVDIKNDLKLINNIFDRIFWRNSYLSSADSSWLNCDWSTPGNLWKIPCKVREFIFIRKETSPTLIRECGSVNFQRFTIHLIKHQVQGHHQGQVPGVDQSVAFQLPSAEDREGFLQNIGSKSMSVVDQF